jgi:hypothetical protein
MAATQATKPSGLASKQAGSKSLSSSAPRGWLNRSRRLAKDCEATIESSHAWVMRAIGSLLLRRLVRGKRRSIISSRSLGCTQENLDSSAFVEDGGSRGDVIAERHKAFVYLYQR